MKKSVEDKKRKLKKSLSIYEFSKEEKRINNMACPCCKSKKKHFSKGTDSNTWIIITYYICLSCGVMYKDLKK